MVEERTFQQLLEQASILEQSHQQALSYESKGVAAAAVEAKGKPESEDEKEDLDKGLSAVISKAKLKPLIHRCVLIAGSHFIGREKIVL